MGVLVAARDSGQQLRPPPRLASLGDPPHKGEGRSALPAHGMCTRGRRDAPQARFAEIAIMAATNKCLAQSNKSRSGVEATKKRKRQGASGCQRLPLNEFRNLTHVR